jgi:hypothetical protein
VADATEQTPPDRLALVADLAGTRRTQTCDFAPGGPRAPASGDPVDCPGRAVFIALVEPGTPAAGAAFFCELHWTWWHDQHVGPDPRYDEWRNSFNIVTRSPYGFWEQDGFIPRSQLAGTRIEYICWFAQAARMAVHEGEVNPDPDPIDREGAAVACTTHAEVWGRIDIGSPRGWSALGPFCLTHWCWLSDDCTMTRGLARATYGRDAAEPWRDVPPEWRGGPAPDPPDAGSPAAVRAAGLAAPERTTDQAPLDRLELVAELAGTLAIQTCDLDRDGPRAADGDGIACGALAMYIALVEPGTPDAGGAFFCELHWGRQQARHAAAYARADERVRNLIDVVADAPWGFWSQETWFGSQLAGSRVELACRFTVRSRRDAFEGPSSDRIDREGAAVPCRIRAVVWGSLDIGPWGGWDYRSPYCLVHWRWLAADCDHTSGYARAILARDGAGSWHEVPSGWRGNPVSDTR